MSDLTLYIGDKTLSSWSFRPWYLLSQAGIPFREEIIRLDRPESRANLQEKTPAGLVPALRHGAIAVWDSLAICEYVCELYPEKQLWPTDPAARAVARSVSAEMHSGFSTLRTVWPMNFNRRDLRHLTSGGVARDIARIDDIWRMCRTEYGRGGDFLFGSLSVADAMYAPVVSRFLTYGPVRLSTQAQAYVETIAASAAFRKWGDGAAAEQLDPSPDLPR